ncbi:hypothetical protein PAMP_015562 [Pampus punctatissimus]
MGIHMIGVRVEMACRRSGNGLGILLVFLLDLLGTTASNMEPIYWNSLNERLYAACPVSPFSTDVTVRGPRCGARHEALNEGFLSAVGGFTQQGVELDTGG